MYLFLGKDSFLENLKTFGINIKESDSEELITIFEAKKEYISNY